MGAPRDDVKRIRELVEAEEREKEERTASMLEKAKTLKAATAGIEREEEEHQLILRINDYIEASLSEGKISRNLYDHLKEALIESVVEGMRADVGGLGSSQGSSQGSSLGSSLGNSLGNSLGSSQDYSHY